ncbi:hypothetical protein AB0C52_24065 [Streptomyces sp. NPDC048717]|uniref:hypothetical protein n=1 Tax=Streptomyces sp. NPDC048717 TaxID=3154928 RepID=UPI00341A0449
MSALSLRFLGRRLEADLAQQSSMACRCRAGWTPSKTGSPSPGALDHTRRSTLRR